MSEPSGLAARRAAQRSIHHVLRRRLPLDEEHTDNASLADPRDRALARQIIGTVLRRLGQVDDAIAACLDRKLQARAASAEDVLRIGAAQILFMRVPPHAAVATSVALLEGREAVYRGLVNAVLRRIAREKDAILARQDAPRLNLPAALRMAWEPHYGAATVDLIAAVHAQDPPLDLTVASDAADWATRLDAQTMPNGTLRCRGGGAIESLAGFADGAWWVQDLASSLPARLLGNVEGRDVIDLCAAPGGKTMQLATAGARVTAIEIGRARAARLNENLARLKLAANVVIADARTWRPEKQADAILLDAPCSATGTIRRHPEIQHLKSRDDALRLTPLQDALLDAAAFMTAPGGTLVYAVCSLEPAEGAERVAAFLSRHTSFLRRSIEPNEIDDLSVCIDAQGDLRTLPCHLADQGGMDGFYAARLVKRR